MEETLYLSSNLPAFSLKRNTQFTRFIHAIQEHIIIGK